MLGVILEKKSTAEDAEEKQEVGALPGFTNMVAEAVRVTP